MKEELIRSGKAATDRAAPFYDRAFELLNRAVKLQPELQKQLSHEPDLESLQNDPRWGNW